MSKFFLFIKSWILGLLTNVKLKWQSMFGKKDNLVQLEELMESEVNEEIPHLESVNDIERTLQLSKPLEEEPLIANKPIEKIQLYDGKYDALFNASTNPIRESLVDIQLWDVIQDKVPEHYIIPNPDSIYFLKKYK